MMQRGSHQLATQLYHDHAVRERGEQRGTGREEMEADGGGRKGFTAEEAEAPETRVLY